MRKDWIKIKNYYITHEISLREIAKKYKVSETAVNKHSKEESWVKLKEEKKSEIDVAVEQKFTEKEIDRKVAANELHNELYNKGLEVAGLLLDKYLSELKTGTKKKTLANAYNLDFVMKAIANAQKGQRLSLNIDKDDTTPAEPEINIIEGLNIDKI